MSSAHHYYEINSWTFRLVLSTLTVDAETGHRTTMITSITKWEMAHRPSGRGQRWNAGGDSTQGEIAHGGRCHSVGDGTQWKMVHWGRWCTGQVAEVTDGTQLEMVRGGRLYLVGDSRQ